MSWHYQIRRSDTKHGPIYAIVEVYTNPHSETVEAITPMSETRKGLIVTLEMMLKDARKRKTLRG